MKLLGYMKLKLNKRQFLGSGGLIDDVFGNEFDIKLEASNLLEKVHKQDISSKGIFSMIKNQAKSLKDLKNKSSDYINLTKDQIAEKSSSLNKQEEK